MRALTGLFLCALACSALATDGLIEGDDQTVYVKDGLYLKIALIDDPRSFLQAWKDNGQLVLPPIQTRTTFRRGEVVFPAITFSTNARNADGEADIACDLLFRRPDGTIYDHMKDLVVIKGPPPKGPSLAKDNAALKIESTDPTGDYTAKATFTDKVRGETVEMILRFRVVAEDEPSTETGPATASKPNASDDPSPAPRRDWGSRIRPSN